jgi:hypothetical protein
VKRKTALVARTPLRRTPLQASRPENLAKRVRNPRKPLRQVGAASKRREPFYEAEKVKLWARAHGRCEACGQPSDPLDPNHVFGRTKVPVRWGYRVELLEASCRPCHDRFDVDAAFREERRLAAVNRLRRVIPPFINTWMVSAHARGWTAIQILREVIRMSEEERVA